MLDRYLHVVEVFGCHRVLREKWRLELWNGNGWLFWLVGLVVDLHLVVGTLVVISGEGIWVEFWLMLRSIHGLVLILSR